MSTFKQGDTVFTVDGHEAEYIAPSPNGGHVVGAIYNTEDAEFDYRPVIEVHQVFAEAPKARLDEQIAEKQAKLAQVSAELSEANRAKYEAERLAEQNAALVEKLSMRHRVLQRIDDWLDGKFTHFVEESGYDYRMRYRIRTLDQIEYERSYAGKTYRLISLLGGSKGNIEWAMGEYSDHSGSKSRVHLASSEGEAQQIVRELCAATIAKWREEPRHNLYGLTELKASLEAIGDKLPIDLQEMIDKQAADAAAEALRKAEEALEAARQKATALTGKEAQP